MNQRNVDVKAGKQIKDRRAAGEEVGGGSKCGKGGGGGHGPPPLRCVIAWQKIRAPRFQLRNKLLRKLEFNLCVRFSKYSQKAAQTERGTVLHHFGIRRIAQFFCFTQAVV